MSIQLSSYQLETEFFNAIKDTPPISARFVSSWEIHILTNEKYAVMCLWALKSLAVTLGGMPDVVIHDDGSLINETVALLSRHLPNARIITEQLVLEDTSFWEQLAKYPALLYWRKEVDLCLARRLIDFRFYANKPYVVVFDTDVLFLRRPEFMLQCASKGLPFAMTDYLSAYHPPLGVLKAVFPKPFPVDINGGLWGVPKTVLDLNTLEETLGRLSENDQQFEWGNFWLDQTLLALLLAEAGDLVMLPPAEYSIAFRRLSEGAAAHHFPNSTARKLYFRVGLRRLHNEGVLRRMDDIGAT